VATYNTALKSAHLDKLKPRRLGCSLLSSTTLINPLITTSFMISLHMTSTCLSIHVVYLCTYHIGDTKDTDGRYADIGTIEPKQFIACLLLYFLTS